MKQFPLSVLQKILVKVEQNQGQCLKEAKNGCNMAKVIGEPTPQYVEICKDAKESEVALDEEIDENQCKSSDEEKLVDNEHNIKASQLPSRSEWED